MSLRILSGKHANQQGLHAATQTTPSLIIDCANRADPHTLATITPPEQLDEVNIIEIDLLYKFRDTLLALPRLMKETGARLILITTPTHLFNYHDEQENTYIYEQAWQLIRRHSLFIDIILCLRPGTIPYDIAKASSRSWDTQLRVNDASWTSS